MRIFHRHYLKELVVNVALTFGVLYFVGLMVAVSKLTYHSAGLDPWLVLKMMIFWSVDPLPHLIPVGTMIGVVLTYGRAGADNEILAVRMGGVHVYQVMLPAIFLGLALSSVNAWLNAEVIPSVYYRKHRIAADVASQWFSKTNPVNNLIDISDFRMRWDHKEGDVFKKVWVDYRKKGRKGLAGYAESVRLLPPRGQYISVIFNDFRGFSMNRMVDEEEISSDINLGYANIDIDVSALFTKQRSIRFGDMTTTQLVAAIESGRIWAPALARHQVHRRMSQSLVALLFALIGAPIGMMFRRGGRMAAFGLSFFPIAGYYALVYLGEGLVVGGAHPAITGWLPSAVLLVVGLGLCYKVSRI